MDLPGQQRGKRAAIEIDDVDARERLDELLDPSTSERQGRIFVPDDFDDPLLPEIQDAFEGRGQT